MTDDYPHEADSVHQLKNFLALIVSYSELVLSETSREDPRRADLIEIQKAARAAMQLVTTVRL